MFKSVPDIFPTSSFEYDPSLRFQHDEIELFDDESFDEISFDEPNFDESDFRREADEWIGRGVNFVDTRLVNKLKHKGYSNSEIIRIIDAIDPEVIDSSIVEGLIRDFNREDDDPTLYVNIIDKLMSRVTNDDDRENRTLKLQYEKFKDFVTISEFIKSGSTRMSHKIYDLFQEFSSQFIRYGLDPYTIRDPDGNLIIDVIVDRLELCTAIGLIELYNLQIDRNQALRLGKRFDRSLTVRNYIDIIDNALDDIRLLYDIVMRIEGITKREIEFWDKMILKWEERYHYIERIFNQSEHKRVSRL